MSKKNKGTVLNMIERERHRVAASITREQDWEQPEPNSGLARMFVIMLLIHVFVIGGIIIYDFVGGDSTTKSTQASATVASTRASSSSTAAHVSTASLPTVASSNAGTPSDAVAPAPETPKTPALSVSETASNSLMPKAVPYTGPLSLTQENPSDSSMAAMAGSKPSPLAVAKANTFDPIAFKPDPADHATSDSRATPTRTSEPAKEKSQPEKAKISPDKPKAQAEKPRVADKPPSGDKPHPVATPSAMRKSLEGDSKPPAFTTAKKKNKDESAPPSTKKTAPKTGSSRKYTIVKGDTVYSLARRYKVSEESIMKANNIKKAGSLGLGKSITIPAAK
ncbi:MAG: hypothetical protein JWO89_1270 [Verrucomicrobiaceae bacterium]|nr:hypothetical protein [Verrucomicrobiaceae bacterium]